MTLTRFLIPDMLFLSARKEEKKHSLPLVLNDVVDFFKTLSRSYVETHCDTCHSAACPALQTRGLFSGERRGRGRQFAL